MAVRRKRVRISLSMHKQLHRPFAELGVPEADIEELAEEYKASDITGLLAVKRDKIPPTTQTILEGLDFTETGPHIIWICILTKRMQELLECSPTEIGVATRDANALEITRGVTSLNDLLNLPPEKLHEVPNFQEVGRKQIRKGLKENGFVFATMPGNIEWVKEQDIHIEGIA